MLEVERERGKVQIVVEVVVEKGEMVKEMEGMVEMEVVQETK